MALNAAFERVAKAAEKRLEATTQKQIRAVEGVGRKAADEAGKVLQAALKAALKNIEQVADELRIFDQQSRRDLRRGLETLNGLVDGAKRGAAAGRAFGAQGAAVGGALGGALGGLTGFAAEEVRQRVTRADIAEARRQLEFENRLREADDRLARLRAATARASAGVQ